MRAGSRSRSRLTISAPSGWSVETRYGPLRDEPLSVDDPDRSFSRPTGWVVAGNLGVRRENEHHRRIAIAGPTGQGVRRADMQAMIRWTLPSLLEVFPRFPQRLLIVSAGDPMWRGALSGPSSLYVHAERPLINERGTSTLLHELVHVAGISRAGPNDGWIVEGLADYYSLQILLRAGVIGEERYRRSLATLERHGESVQFLDRPRGGADVTARAVGVMVALDAEIRTATEGHGSLDDVARVLAESDAEITLLRLRETAEEAAGTRLTLFDSLPVGSSGS